MFWQKKVTLSKMRYRESRFPLSISSPRCVHFPVFRTQLSLLNRVSTLPGWVSAFHSTDSQALLPSWTHSSALSQTPKTLRDIYSSSVGLPLLMSLLFHSEIMLVASWWHSCYSHFLQSNLHTSVGGPALKPPTVTPPQRKTSITMSETSVLV